MRKKEEIIDSKRYSSILFKIVSENNYTRKIAKELEIKPNALIEHIKRLKKENFIIGVREKGKYNKTIYSINWEKIIDEFHKFHFPEKTKEGTSVLGFQEFEKKEWYPKGDRLSFNPKNLKKNTFLISFLKYIFESLDKNKDDENEKNNIQTIKEIFKAIPDIFISRLLQMDKDEELILKNKIEKDSEFKEFFVFILISYETSYKRPLINSIVDGMKKFILELFPELKA